MIKSERRAAGGWQFPPIRVQRSEITSSGRKLHPGISLRVGPFHLFQPSPFDTSAAHYATRHPRLVRSRFRAQKYVHRPVKSALANLFVILSPISFFLLRFSPFFFFFLELLIVYIRCSFDIGEIENRGRGISGGKKEKRNIEGSLTHHLYG